MPKKKQFNDDKTKIQLPKNYYIRRLDSRNWVIGKMVTLEYKTKEGIYDQERIEGYYHTLENAWDGAVDKFSLMVDNFPDVVRIIKELKALKVQVK